ncbi:hypothetical protein DAHU10_003040 [Hanseniaspora uvarum]|nr:hypothetical protein DAHU10_003040 [Hanseniaspora uvarum]
MLKVILSSTLSSIVQKRSEECKGSSQECEKPASSSYTKAIILGVLIPVAVIAIIFGGIFIHLKKKSKREQMEMQEDPDFDGNLDFYEYDTPQIANTFNQVNNDNFLLSKENDLDYEKEAEYEANNNRYNSASRTQAEHSNPFD